jgi:hypothetical protein
MKIGYGLPLVIFGTAAIAFAQPWQAYGALTVEQIAKIADQVSVQIDGQKATVTVQGSGSQSKLISSNPEEVYLNAQCKQVNNSEDAFRVDFRRNIQSGGKSYWFSMARYIDGAAIFCLTEPNYTRGKILAAEQIQRQFIKEIKQESRANSFLITVRHGNGI